MSLHTLLERLRQKPTLSTEGESAAPLFNLRMFNFAAHRFQSIYLGVYLFALAVDVFDLWTRRANQKGLSQGQATS